MKQLVVATAASNSFPVVSRCSRVSANLVFRHVLQERLSITWGRDLILVKKHGLGIVKYFEVSKVLVQIRANCTAIDCRLLRAFTACSTTLRRTYLRYKLIYLLPSDMCTMYSTTLIFLLAV